MGIVNDHAFDANRTQIDARVPAEIFILENLILSEVYNKWGSVSEKPRRNYRWSNLVISVRIDWRICCEVSAGVLVGNSTFSISIFELVSFVEE